jgi:hypothetical protein
LKPLEQLSDVKVVEQKQERRWWGRGIMDMEIELWGIDMIRSIPFHRVDVVMGFSFSCTYIRRGDFTFQDILQPVLQKYP